MWQIYCLGKERLRQKDLTMCFNRAMLLLLLVYMGLASSLQTGFLSAKLEKGQTLHFGKRLTKGAEIKLALNSRCVENNQSLYVKWTIVGMDCFARYYFLA